MNSTKERHFPRIPLGKFVSVAQILPACLIAGTGTARNLLILMNPDYA